ncbi:MAG: T9SS type A sorting domain-containing protein [Bacteroidota bacterium]
MKRILLSALLVSFGINTYQAQTTVVDVTNPTTGKTWMDRNLGATQAATSSTDAAAYGDYYQWGRGADGHQVSSSTTIFTVSANSTPGHGDFIVNTVSPHNWFEPSSDNLWQGVNGVNNPCPSGYRIPTTIELQEEYASWSSPDDVGAFNSVLKLPLAGVRQGLDGTMSAAGSIAYYYSSDLGSSTTTTYLAFLSGVVGMYNSNRANGMSCRCIKDASAGINENSSSLFSVFPNPASAMLTVKSNFQIEKIEVYDLKGTLMQTETSNEFSIENLTNGMYFVTIHSNNLQETIKVIKQ